MDPSFITKNMFDILESDSENDQISLYTLKDPMCVLDDRYSFQLDWDTHTHKPTKVVTTRTPVNPIRNIIKPYAPRKNQTHVISIPDTCLSGIITPLSPKKLDFSDYH